MKKIYTIIAALLFCTLSFAKAVSEETARKTASNFFSGVSLSSLELVYTACAADGVPTFYAFNNSRGGFVLVSASDCLNPVLGYSMTGSFKSEDMPSNVRGWFSSLSASIRELDSRQLCVKNIGRSYFNGVSGATKAGTSKLMTTATWGQNSPYNDLCEGCASGCVATAMAIVLRYNKYPAKGKGTLPSYKYGTISIPGYSIDNHRYDWDSMPMTDAEVQAASASQKQQIAQILRDCGVMVKMQYGPSSGAYSMDVGPALVQYMSYDPGVRYIMAEFYKPSEWYSLLMDELSKGYPVIIGASDAKGGGGHEFVLDGYDANGYFHVNWGWNGLDNAYYSLLLDAPGFQFSVGQDALIGLRPSGSGEVETKAMPLMSGLKVTGGEFAKGKSLKLYYEIANRGAVDFKIKVYPVVIDKDGKVKEKLSEAEIELEIPGTTDHSYYYNQIEAECKFASDVELTDRLVIMYEAADGKAEKMPFRVDNSWAGSIIPQSVRYIDVNPNSYKSGDMIDLLLLGNNDWSSVEWYFDDVKTSLSYALLTAGTHTIKAVVTSSDGSIETIVQQIVVK